MSSEENQKSEETKESLSDAEGLESTENNSHKQEKIQEKIQENKTEQEEKSANSGKKIARKKKTLEEKLSSKMFTYARETICFFLAVAFTALAALHSSPPRISKPPVAKPFFNENSIVLDFYKGHLSALVDRVTDSDFSFVMYYAPWDADSQAIKEEFENVAKYYHSHVFFAAINCWHPGSECRTRYSKIQSYPVLMLYPFKESGVQYKGIKSAPYMIRFIHTFMNPIKRAYNDDDLIDLMKSYDIVMIGYFQFAGLTKSPGYKEFYKAALRSLEKDPNGEIAFAAITNVNTAQSHGVTHVPSASLLMWNETLFYPDINDWTADNLVNWISNVNHRVITWLQPPGIKSSTFASYLWDGPVLFLFTPRNPLYFENDNYNLLKEIGLQYYDCTENQQIADIVSRLRESRLSAALKAFEKRERCMNSLEQEKSRRSSFSEFYNDISKTTQQHWTNSSANCCSDIPTNKCVICTKSNEGLNDVCAAPGTAACRGIDIFELTHNFLDQSRSRFNSINVKQRSKENGVCTANSCESIIEGIIDPQSAEAVKKSFYKEDCRKFLAGYSYQRPVFPQDSGDKEEIELTDQICKVNKTLALVAIDSLQYFHFAEGLGIDVTDAKDKTIAVILDPADESEFVMQGEFSRNSLVLFVNNYTNGYLRRTMRSNKYMRFVRSVVTKNECKKEGKSKICIPELSTETFLDAVLNPKKNVVVMYHSPYCAFCSAVAYVYLTVAQYLRNMNHLEFLRIDGDNNDLPWEYTMNRYPSILFFPARRKEDSTLFPWNLPVSVGNLLNFVLANLDEESHIEALINVCATGAGGSPNSCVLRIRLLCLDVLEDYLRDFRKLRRFRGDKKLLDNQRRILLLKLELVREIHLLLGSSNNLTKNEDKVQVMRKRFKKFYSKLANLRRDKKSELHSIKSEGKKMEQRS